MMHAEKIASYCKSLAEEKNISTEQIAERIGYSVDKIESFFAGDFILPYWKLETLSEMLGTSVSQILDATE